jgi:two-component system chemotaxis response regulator CheY
MINLDGVMVLIVDDDRFMRSTIKTVLRAVARFVVLEADDGDAALIKAEELKPDVVLCDISMPRLGGLRFIELLREHRDRRMRDLPVIILTGHAEEPTVIAASKLRIGGYLIKPISPKQINDQLQVVLASRQTAPMV